MEEEKGREKRQCQQPEKGSARPAILPGFYFYWEKVFSNKPIEWCLKNDCVSMLSLF